MLEEMGPNDMFLQQAAINKCLKTQLETASLPGLLCGEDTDSSFELWTFLCFSDS